MTTATKCEIRESILSESKHSVDRNAGIIPRVKILGRESRNGRTYSDKAMQSAATLYEGAKVNIDHTPRSEPDRERAFAEGFGELRGVKVDGDGVYGDLHYIKSHPMAATVAESAERFPKQFGLSHHAEGEMVKRDGKWVVESIDSVRSVDIVGRPATNAGLFESVDLTGENSVRKTTFKKIAESAPAGDHKKRLVALLEEEPAMGAMEVEAPAESDPNEDVKLALEKAAAGVVKKWFGGDIDDSEALKKLKQLKGMKDKAADEGGAGGGETPAVEAPAVTESVRKLTDKIERMEARDVLREHHIEVTEDRVKKYLAAGDESVRKELLESWPKRINGGAIPRPSVSRPLRESDGGSVDVSLPKDAKEFARMVR